MLKRGIEIVVLGLVLSVAACSDDDSSSPSCVYNSDCTGSQVCLAGQCRNQCVTDKDCTTGQTCSAGACAVSAVSSPDAGSTNDGGPPTHPTDAAAPDAGPEAGTSFLEAGTASPDGYLDKNDFIPVELTALDSNTAPGTFSPAVRASEPLFYTQSTLLTYPEKSGFVGLTSYSRTDLVRWEVTETTLVARRASELVVGSTLKQPVVGDPVAVFKITLHFDIINAPDASDGSTAAAQDTTSRPWYQRRYMQVDWSQNLASGSPSAAFDIGLGQVSAESIAMPSAGPGDPNAPFFDYTALSATSKRLDYFDIVDQARLHPESTTLGTVPAVPICALSIGDVDCSPSLVTWRTGFRRVDADRDYQAVGTGHGDGNVDGTRFGVLDATTVGPFGAAQTANAVRHNVWVHHHALVYGANTTALCNADADCAAGTTCHIATMPADATHRGACAPAGFDHRTSDAACTADADCHTYGSGALSPTAACDAGTKTCGERYVRCSTNADCKSVDAQSTCDGVSNTLDGFGLCLMPVRQRQVRPVAYFESADYPDALQPAVAQAVSEWNGALSTAIATARRHECEIDTKVDPVATPLASNACNAAGVTGVGADAKFVVVGCHNPVWGTAAGPGQHAQTDVDAAHAAGWDLAACGPQGTTAHSGDLRHHLIEAITDRSDAQDTWGLSNVAADARSGEIVAGRARVYKQVIDGYASNVVELVRLLRNEPDVLQLIMKQPGATGSPSDLILDQPLRVSALPTLGILSTATVADLVGDGSNGAGRLLSLKGSTLEHALLNADQARLASGSAPDDSALLTGTIDIASPLREQSPSFRRSIEKFRSLLRESECRVMPRFSADRVFYLALELAGAKPILASNAEDASRSFGQDWTFLPNGGSFDYALAARYASLAMAHATLAHGLGHTLGLREALASSADAVNFGDVYWKGRGKGHASGLKPRYQYLADATDGVYYSQAELAAGIEEYAYSSVMDERDVADVAHGLGRYDVAALKDLYGNVLEAFRSVASSDQALMYSFNVAGVGLSTPLDLSAWPTAIHGMHYSQIPAIFGVAGDGTPNIAEGNRYDVFSQETLSAAVAGWGPSAASNATIDGHVLVPYRSCGGACDGRDWRSQRGDRGADEYESVHSIASRMLDGYFANSFINGRRGLSAASYQDHLFAGAIDPLRREALMGIFDLIVAHDDFPSVPNFGQFANSAGELGGVVNQVASSTALDALVGLLTMPELGSFAPKTQFDKTPLVVPDLSGTGASPITILAGNGRNLASLWGTNAGTPWFDQLDRAGAYYDKATVISALMDRELSHPSWAQQQDGPSMVQLGFGTVYPGQMVRMMGGLLANDFTDVAPIITSIGTDVHPVHFATINAPTNPSRTIDGSHQLIDPNVSLALQSWIAIVFGTNVDPAFQDYPRIWIDGSPSAFQIDPTRMVAFSDPASGFVYRALDFPATKADTGGTLVGASRYVHPLSGAPSPQAGVGARMLSHLADIEAVRQAAIATNDATTAANAAQMEKTYLGLVKVLVDLSASLTSH